MGAIVAGGALVSGLAACAPHAAEPTVTTLTTNMLSYMIPGSWSPADVNTYNTLVQAPYESLVRLNGATAQYEPLLAESFEIGEDRRTMELTLREDVDFTDGTHLDAEAAKEAFEFAIRGPYHEGRFSHTDVGVEVTGEYELRITSTAPMNEEFMFAFVIVPIASPTAIRDDPDGLAAVPVGTGPYVLDEQIPDASISFVRNPHYRDPGAYPFDAIEFRLFEDSIAVSNALKTGQINAASLDVSLVADVEAQGFDVYPGGGGSFLLYWQDVDGAIQPALADVRVRQAIAYAFDRRAIVDAIEYGYGTPVTQAWGPGSIHHLDGEDDRYAFDLDRAKELMEEAGYPDGFDLTMPSFSGNAKYEPILIQTFADIGIRLTFDQYPDGAAFSAAAGSYAMSAGGNADLFLANAIRLVFPQILAAFPALSDAYDAIDAGTLEEADEAAQAIGRIVLDEALVIVVSRFLEAWATVPEISLEPGIIQGWPPQLSGFQFAG